MIQHPSLEEVALWVLDPDQVTPETRMHLRSTCFHCIAIVDSMRDVLESVGSAVQHSPPKALVTRWSHEQAPVETRGPLFLLAELTHDTRVLAGARGISAGDRYLIFACGSLEIDLRITLSERASGYDVRGQVHGPNGTDLGGLEVRVMRDGDPLGVVATDRTGAFHISRMEPPPFHFQFLGASIRVKTPEIPS